mmetsp:Transcript_12791/g.39530  ORF Transcript_12791/g.39530 Transcript_12791/m.39530 type:complete len:262 (-) Transcript_12791:442-1227(-)
MLELRAHRSPLQQAPDEVRPEPAEVPGVHAEPQPGNDRAAGPAGLPRRASGSPGNPGLREPAEAEHRAGAVLGLWAPRRALQQAPDAGGRPAPQVPRVPAAPRGRRNRGDYGAQTQNGGAPAGSSAAGAFPAICSVRGAGGLCGFLGARSAQPPETTDRARALLGMWPRGRALQQAADPGRCCPPQMPGVSAATSQGPDRRGGSCPARGRRRRGAGAQHAQPADVARALLEVRAPRRALQQEADGRACHVAEVPHLFAAAG